MIILDINFTFLSWTNIPKLLGITFGVAWVRGRRLIGLKIPPEKKFFHSCPGLKWTINKIVPVVKYFYF